MPTASESDRLHDGPSLASTDPAPPSTTPLMGELDVMAHGGKAPLARELEAIAQSPAAQTATEAGGTVPGATGRTDIGKVMAGVAQGASVAGALASGDAAAAGLSAVQLAGLMNHEAAQAGQIASQAAGLASTFGSNASPLPTLEAADFDAGVSTAPPAIAPPGAPDDHPLTGQSIADATPPSRAYAPPMVDAKSGAELASRPSLLQDNSRLMRLISPLKGEKRLYVASISGGSALSELSRYQLQLLSHHAGIELKEVLGKNLSVLIKLADGGEHPINGYVANFGFAHTDGGLAVYTAELVPWLWYLGKRTNSRIFQDVNALDVVAQVFKDYGGLPDYEVRVFRQPPVQNYVVQYGETDLNFVSRLLEQYGLFYYFEHRPDGHKLVICDDSTHPQACPPQAEHPTVWYNAGQHVSRRDELTYLAAHRQVQVGAVALSTYDFKAPTDARYIEQSTVTQQGEVPLLQEFDGTPAFAYRDTEDGNREAKRRLESYEWQSKLFIGRSDCRGLIAGHTFKVMDHHWFEPSDEDGSNLLVVGVQIDARNNFGFDGSHDVYTNTLTLIRRKIPYRPLRAHSKPVMKGPQSATVVGPKGQEIHTDRFGRIKVQFPWDRYGKFDAGSSCWIRVSQPWAGRGWGTIAIPRIGQEVIVDFLDGDPDRPVCVGRLFNAEQAPPRGLPDAAHTMGFISNSTPGGGGQCRMLIKDAAGEELIDLFSQKDMEIETLNNQTTVVRGPRQATVVTTGKQLTSVHDSILTRSETSHICTVAKTAILIAAETEAMGLQAEKYVQIQSNSEHVVIRAKTAIRLEVGASSLELREDGSIALNGKLVQIVGTDSIDLNP